MPTSTSMLPCLFALCVAVGCADDDDEPADDGGFRDGGPEDADIPGDGPLPDAYAGCGLAEGYGTVIALDQEAIRNGEPGYLEWKLVGSLGLGAQVDIALREDTGSFAGTIPAPGEYAIGSGDVAPTTCGLCISVSAMANANLVFFYHATAGNLTLTAVDDERLTGEATDLTFQRFDPVDREPLDDGCQTTVASFPFDAEVVVTGPI